MPQLILRHIARRAVQVAILAAGILAVLRRSRGRPT